MDDLRAIGAHNVTAGRARGLTSPRRLKAMREHYEGYRDAEGRLPATYEVVYGHAWSTDVLPQRQLEPGVVGVPVSGIRRRGE
jgi:malonyl-CoA O-methyltransferase